MRWAPPVVAVALLLAGCGGDGDGIAKEDLVERGDDICREQQPAIRERADAAAADGTAEDEVVRDVLLTGLRDMFAEVRDLGTPSGDEAVVGAPLDRIVELLDGTIDGAPLDGFAGAYEPLVGELRSYGFEVCGQE